MNSSISTVQQTGKSQMTGGVLRWFLVDAVVILVMGGNLFISAGRLDWVMAWTYIGVLVVAQVASLLILLASNPALLAERSWVQKGSKDWDKVLVSLGEFGLLGISIAAGLDVRFGWSPPISPVLQISGLALAVLGYSLFLWAMASNRFFSAYVRIQTDRGHTVATTGPYQYVRHPGYVGGILLYLGIPIMLGSLWALVPTALLIVMTIIRTALEDQTLQIELVGYTDYTQRVRYRLLPNVW